MKIHFDCRSGSCCLSDGVHQPNLMKRYIAEARAPQTRSQNRQFELVFVCDNHFIRHVKYGWKNMTLACLTGCNHIKCQIAYKE